MHRSKDWLKPFDCPDFWGEVGFNIALGLVTSCCGRHTAYWRPSCCWLQWDSMSSVTQVEVGAHKKAFYCHIYVNKLTVDHIAHSILWKNPLYLVRCLEEVSVTWIEPFSSNPFERKICILNVTFIVLPTKLEGMDGI